MPFLGQISPEKFLLKCITYSYLSHIVLNFKGHLESTHDMDVFHAHIYEQSSLEEKFEYSFHPLHENYFGKYFEFMVKTEGAISIALSADESQQVDMYEVGES